ncbi:MAG: hypothetical protein KGL12_13320, partial [Rhodospirillales bacterium]|nr:hypothetical protein [Rhodospirillales bacterium]
AGAPADATALRAALAELRREADAALTEEGIDPAARAYRYSAAARYGGQSSEIAVALPDLDPADPAGALISALPGLFAAEHIRTYGFGAPDGEPVEMIGITLRAGPRASAAPVLPRAPAIAAPAATRRAWFADGGWRDVAVYRRADLSARGLRGPLIVQEYDATALVPAGWSARLDASGLIRLEADPTAPA